MELNLLHKYFINQTTQHEEDTIRIWLNESPENKNIFLRERKLFDTLMLNNTEDNNLDE